MRRATSLIHTLPKKNIAQFVLIIMLSIKIKDVHPCQNTEWAWDVYAIVRTGPRATHMVCAGNLVPADTMLVTPAVEVEH